MHSISSSNAMEVQSASVTLPQHPRSHRRRRPGAQYFGSVLLLVCLSSSSSSWALAPSSPRSSAAKTPSSSLSAQAGSSRAPVVEKNKADMEFTVPVTWDEESTLAYLERRRRQYNPAAADGAVLSMAPSTDSPYDATDKEFELHVGKALDTLRSDYPKLLTTLPDLSIYDRNIEVVDPSGVKVHGLKTYQNSFRLLQGLVRFLYCPGRSTMSFRMCFDKARRNIRIHWNAAVVPREVFGGSRSTLHVDGISVYELDQKSGNIVQHRIEQLLINNMPVQPKEGVIAALHDEHAVTVPSFYRGQNSHIVRFQPAGLGRASLPSSLFAMEVSDPENSSAEDDPSSSSAFAFDHERFEAKNRSRKKFGLKPLTEEEFMELEVQVRQMDAEQKQRAAAAQAQTTATTKPEEKSGSFMDKLFGNVLKDTCESNWDCERPEVCCDFGFKKMCCSSGSLVADGFPQPALVPVPVDVGPPRTPDRRYY